MRPAAPVERAVRQRPRARRVVPPQPLAPGGATKRSPCRSLRRSKLRVLRSQPRSVITRGVSASDPAPELPTARRLAFDELHPLIAEAADPAWDRGDYPQALKD